jgi:hypothetical protein
MESIVLMFYALQACSLLVIKFREVVMHPYLSMLEGAAVLPSCYYRDYGRGLGSFSRLY